MIYIYCISSVKLYALNKLKNKGKFGSLWEPGYHVPKPDAPQHISIRSLGLIPALKTDKNFETTKTHMIAKVWLMYSLMPNF